MAASLDERIAEAVRRFPVLYDKSCKEFRDINQKMNAWEDVAKIAGLSSGEEAKTYFTNLRTRYTRDRKKLSKVKVSGTGSEDVLKVKDEVEDMFFYLAWLDPFYKPRKTSSNFITIDSGNEGSEDDNTQYVDDKSNTTETTTSDADNYAASNFRPTRKPKLQMKRKSAGKNQDVANAEVQVLQSIGEKLGQKQTPDFKDEDELFGAWIASQIRQIAPERKVVAKMQISNIVYQEMLALFDSVPFPYTEGQGSWKYPQQQMQELHQAQQHQPQQQQHRQHHSFRDRVVRNQNQKSFQIPSLLEPSEVPLMKPGQLFYQNKPQTGFLNDLEQGS